jgi:hypothetical protein
MGKQLAACTLEAVAAPENLLVAAKKARKGKSRRPDVEAWWLKRETEVLRLSDELLSGAWRPSGYRFFEIHDPKRRTIAAAPFTDRVVHHALCHLMGPQLERRFIARSFSCQVGKGTTAARDCCQKLVNRHEWVLKCDVRKFFPSLVHEVLLKKLGGVLRCAGILDLCEKIIWSHRTQGVEPASGLPIGNLTSQLWGNFYLDEMDHSLTERERCGAYLRYTDDFLLFGDTKQRLWELGEVVERELQRIGLEMARPKSRLLRCGEGVAFCGFQLFPRLCPRILGTTKRRFENRWRRLLKAGEVSRLSDTVRAWYAFSLEGNSLGLRMAWRRVG